MLIFDILVFTGVSISSPVVINGTSTITKYLGIEFFLVLNLCLYQEGGVN
jgi:hypothetical protein